MDRLPRRKYTKKFREQAVRMVCEQELTNNPDWRKRRFRIGAKRRSAY